MLFFYLHKIIFSNKKTSHFLIYIFVLIIFEHFFYIIKFLNDLNRSKQHPHKQHNNKNYCNEN